MSFNFGSNLGANTNQPGFGFGAAKTNTPTFGTLGNAQSQPSGSITFGTPIASVAPTQQNTGLSFGTPTLGTGLNFASPAPSAPNTGLNFATPAKTTGLSFGTPTAQTQPGLSFGTPTAQTQPGLSFGTPTAQTQPGLSFGTPTAQTQPGLSFGTPAAQTQPGLNFGTPAGQNQPGLNFGTPATQPTLNFSGATPTLNFNTSSAAPTGLSFGAPSTSTATPGLSFGAPPPASTGLSFGTPASSAGLSFGAASTANSAGFPLGGTTTTASNANPLGGINFGAAPITSTSLGGSLSFNTPATSNPNPLGGISFATTPASSTGFTLGTGSTTTPGLTLGAASTSTGLNFGLGGTTTSTAPTLNFKPGTTATGLNFGFNTPKTQATTTLSLGSTPASTPIGLGGVDSSQLKTGTVSTGRTDTVAAKENQVPNEILQSIESFKHFVKDQKSQSSDVSRGSARPFVKVREDIDLINSILTDVGNDLQRNQQQADKLKHDSAKCLHNAEMAQRTNDTPPGLQFENNAPLRYFIELVNQFEQDLQALRVQIDVTDKHFQSLHEPKFLTSQELATGMRRLHDTFVALAGRLHSVHTQVESHKEQYLNLRKYILKDPTNIFIKPASKEEQALDVVLRGLTANKSVSGPTPFSSFGSPFGINIMQAQQNAVKPPPAYPAATTSLNFGSGAGTSLLGSATPQLGANTSLFGNSTLPQTDSSFQLQNPPLGNKRGKR